MESQKGFGDCLQSLGRQDCPGLPHHSGGLLCVPAFPPQRLAHGHVDLDVFATYQQLPIWDAIPHGSFHYLQRS
eukprot:176443-Pelagomonas_calceolata.AAC.1